MQCFVCGMKIEEGYLCKKHTQELKKMLLNEQNVINNPDFKQHCLICGEYKERVIIEYPSVGCFCDRDIETEARRIQKMNKSQ